MSRPCKCGEATLPGDDVLRIEGGVAHTADSCASYTQIIVDRRDPGVVTATVLPEEGRPFIVRAEA